MADFFKRVPQELWNTHFTPEQTAAMRKTQIQTIIEEQSPRGFKVFRRLLELEEFNFHAHKMVPGSLEELEEARSKEQSDARMDRIKEIFGKSERSDSWVDYIFEEFKDALASDYTLAEGSRFREYSVGRIADWFEVMTRGYIFRELERELRRGRSFDDMFTGPDYHSVSPFDNSLLRYIGFKMRNIDRQ